LAERLKEKPSPNDVSIVSAQTHLPSIE